MLNGLQQCKQRNTPVQGELERNVRLFNLYSTSVLLVGRHLNYLNQLAYERPTIKDSHILSHLNISLSMPWEIKGNFTHSYHHSRSFFQLHAPTDILLDRNPSCVNVTLPPNSQLSRVQQFNFVSASDEEDAGESGQVNRLNSQQPYNGHAPHALRAV